MSRAPIRLEAGARRADGHVGPVLDRRALLRVLGLLGFSSAAAQLGCGKPIDLRPAGAPQGPPVTRVPPPEVTPLYDDDLDTLMDVILPSERGPGGEVLRAGAVEVGAAEALKLDNFVRLLRAQGLLQPGVLDLFDEHESFDVRFRALLVEDLALLAAIERPGEAFRRLPRALQEAAVERGLSDPAVAPFLELVRAACFLAYLGALKTDQGLIDVGYPPFEDFAGGVAVSGYPRTLTGRRIDVDQEDVAALIRANNWDDYSYNRAPLPTPSDDLSDVLDEQGDLR